MAGLAKLTAVAIGIAATVGCARTRADNILIVTLDTTRRDHVSTYGYARETTPALDGLARRATVFDNAFAQETNTNPSHASLFTGQYPHVHGSLDNGYVLQDGRVTLAETLRSAGFRTAAFVSGYTMLAKATGLERGFEVYDDRLPGPKRRGADTVDRAIAWLDGLRGRERFCLFVHLYDAHGPYEAPPGYENRFRSTAPGAPLRAMPDYQRKWGADGALILDSNVYVDLYDAAIRYQDDALTRLLDAVDLDRTAVVVWGDHGETLAERYWGLAHGGEVFDEQIRIPLVVHVPGAEPGRVAELVETVDLLPTLLEVVRVAAPQGASFSGRSLAPLWAAGEPPARTEVFATARADTHRYADRGYRFDGIRRIHTVREPRWKLTVYPGLERDYLELYDLDRDPGETSNLAERHPERAQQLRAKLDAWLSDASAVSTPAELSDEELDKLRSLGYVGGDGH